MQEQTYSDIRQIVCDVLEIDPSEVEPATQLRALPGVESIKVLRIITKIEARYAVELDEQVVFNVGTMDELVAEIVKLRALGARPQPERVAGALD